MALHSYIGNRRYHLTPLGLLPGVTTVLSATQPSYKRRILENWKNKVGEKQAQLILEEACERGTAVHKAIENRLTKNDCITNQGLDSHKLLFESFSPILQKVSNVLYVEKPTYHSYGFAGSPDLVADFQSICTVIDWKTSTKTKSKSQISEYILQVAAYSASIQETLGVKVEQALIAIATQGKTEARTFIINRSELSEAWQEFQQRLYQYHTKHTSEGF